MLKRHPHRLTQLRKPHSTPVRIAPSALTIPTIAPGIPRTFQVNTGREALCSIADAFVDAGVFREQDFPRGHKHLKLALEDRLAEIATAARPRPLIPNLQAVAIDDAADLGVAANAWARGSSRHTHLNALINANTPLKALMICFPATNGMHAENIGPALRALEAWPRIGQTVLDILESGLAASVRCLSPGFGIDWASRQYWQGEEDETNWMEEMLSSDREYYHRQARDQGKPIPTDAEIIKQEFDGYFTRQDYTDAIPEMWHRKRRPLASLPERLGKPAFTPGAKLIEVFGFSEQMRERWPEIRSMCLNIKQLYKHRARFACDKEHCEYTSWEAVPLMLRFDGRDPLPRIADDVWQDIWNTGDVDMDVINVFLWHDVPSLVNALKCLNYHLCLTQACEDLVKLLIK